jgi:GNAT superfamily N-acetyltransferase
MNLYIREAAVADAAAVTNLSEQLGYRTSTPETANRIEMLAASTDNCVFVAERQGEVIGWIHGFCAIRLESAPFTEIGGLVVDERYRGLGIGKKLIAQVVAWSKQKGILSIRVRCNTKRTPTHAFYRHMGFSETKEQKIFDLKLSAAEGK